MVGRPTLCSCCILPASQIHCRERLATDPGVGWLRLYPRRVGTFDQVVAEAQQFIASFVAAEQAQTTEVAPKEGAVAEASTLDVFGDKVTARGTDGP